MIILLSSGPPETFFMFNQSTRNKHEICKCTLYILTLDYVEVAGVGAEGSTRRCDSSQLFTAGTTPVLRTQGRGGYSRLQLAVRPPSRGATPAACARGAERPLAGRDGLLKRRVVLGELVTRKKSLTSFILDQSK